MKKSDFYKGLKEIFENENLTINDQTNLNSIPGYDSMAHLGIIAFVDENFDLQLNTTELNNAEKVIDLMNMIGLEKFED